MINKIQMWLEEKTGFQSSKRQAVLLIVLLIVLVVAIFAIPFMKAKSEINRADDSFYVPAE